MTAEERQFRIGEHLKRVEFASLSELSELVDASESTVRRDLQILEGKSTVKRAPSVRRYTAARTRPIIAKNLSDFAKFAKGKIPHE